MGVVGVDTADLEMDAENLNVGATNLNEFLLGVLLGELNMKRPSGFLGTIILMCN